MRALSKRTQKRRMNGGGGYLMNTLAKRTHKQMNNIVTRVFRAIDSIGYAHDPKQTTTVYSVTQRPPFVSINARRAAQYQVFRIPVLVQVPLPSGNGSVLFAFAEARMGVLDTGSIDIVCRRSFDRGYTWDEAIIVVTHSDIAHSTKANTHIGRGVCGNPCVVVNEYHKTLVMVFSHNHAHHIEQSIRQGNGIRSMWMTQCPIETAICTTQKWSTGSHGWSTPVNITPMVKQPHWTWLASGPGVGIAIHNPDTKNNIPRLLIPCDHSTLNAQTGEMGHGAHLIYSDNGGHTWKIGMCLDGAMLIHYGIGLNECQVVAVPHNTTRRQQKQHLILNCRSLDNEVVKHATNVSCATRSRKDLPYITSRPATPHRYVRRVAISRDAGQTCESLHDIRQHSDVANCQVGFVSAIRRRIRDSPQIWFSNPANTKGRRGMVLRLLPASVYEAPRSNPNQKNRDTLEKTLVLRKGACAYSSLAALSTNTVGVMFETGTWLPGVSQLMAAAITYHAIVYRMIDVNMMQ